MLILVKRFTLFSFHNRVSNKITHILVFLLISLTGSAQVIEKSFLTTDKTIYAPEDTVWFKAYVFDRINVISDQSVALHVLVADVNGNKKVDTSWPILGGLTDGYFVVPKEEGQYTILAISGQMIDSKPSLAFKKAFYVRSDLADEFLISAFPQFDLLNIIDKNKVDIFTQFSLDKRAPRKRLRFQVLEGDKILQEGRIRTDKRGKVTLVIDKVQEAKGNLVLLIESDEKDLSKPIKLAVPLVIARKAIDLQVFPEGGSFIAEVANRVAVKAIDEQGQPFDFKALLMDEAGQVLDTVSSLYAGMGSFNLIPKTNQRLHIEIIEPNVQNTIFQMEVAQASGVALSIVGEAEQRLIRLLPNQEASGETFKVEITQFDRLIQSTESRVEHRQFFKIPWESLAPGLVKVTLFKDQNPHAERVFFHKPSAQLNINLVTDKEEYLSREKVEVEIEVTDDEGRPVMASFSVAAIDAVRSLSPVQGHSNILSSLLLTSEIRGEVPTPDFYFSDHELAVSALDIVTLTNGYRKYIPSRLDDPEKISGFLLDNASKRKLLKDRSISLIDLQDLNLGSFNTDETGRFTVPSAYLKSKGDTFIISSSTLEEKDRFRLVFDDTLRIDKVRSFKRIVEKATNTNNYKVYQSTFKIKQDRFNGTTLLNSVTVEAKYNLPGTCELQDYHFEKPWMTKKVEELDLINNGIMNLLMQVSNDIKGYGDGLGVYINEKTGTGPVFKYYDAILSSQRLSNRFKQPFKIYLNCEEVKDDYFFGSTQPASFYANSTLEFIDFSNLESISVFVPRNPPYPSLPKIEINTVNDVIIRTETFQKVRFISAYENYSREFYSPKYDTPKKQNDPIPDLKTTIFWQANVVSDENGKAKVSFYNADRTNPVIITVEGVDQLSHVGSATTTYQVIQK